MMSTAPGSRAIATTTRSPFLVTAMLFGWSLSGIFLISAPLTRSNTSSVESASLLTYTFEPSVAKPMPCAASIPLISCTTLLVAGSITWMLSPALLVM
jgi:hypothetical protein